MLQAHGQPFLVMVFTIPRVPHTTHKGSGIVFTVIFDRGPEHRFCLIPGINSITGHMCGKKTCRHRVVYEPPKRGVAIVGLNHSACYLP